MNPLTEGLRSLYRGIENGHPSLEYLFLEITRECDFSCRHCGSDCSSAAGSKGLGLEAWKSLLASVCASFSPPPFLVFTGGEPLLFDGLEDLGRAALAAGARWGLVTNAWHLGPGRIGSLTASGMRSLTVSLDGDSGTHDHFRGRRGSHERALAAIREASAAGGLLSDVVTCVHPGNIGQLDELTETLVSAGAARWRLFRVFPRGRAADGSLTLSVTEYRRLLDWIAEKRPVLKKRGLILDLSCDGWLPFGLDRKVRSNPFTCQSGSRIASILHDGSVTGCPNNHPGLIQGNALRESFASIWMKGFKPYRDRSWADFTGCASCNLFKHCRGGSMHSWDWPPVPGALPGACLRN